MAANIRNESSRCREKRMRPICWEEIWSLYLRLLKQFYGRQRRVQNARADAERLDHLLDVTPGSGQAILGQQARALTAEVRGDLLAAIRHRRRATNLITRLLMGNYPFQDYDWSDVRDSLNLLALLYDEAGDSKSALKVLDESEQICRTHGVEFDAGDLADEIRTSPQQPAGARKRGGKGFRKRGGKGFRDPFRGTKGRRTGRESRASEGGRFRGS